MRSRSTYKAGLALMIFAIACCTRGLQPATNPLGGEHLRHDRHNGGAEGRVVRETHSQVYLHIVPEDLSKIHLRDYL